MKRTRVDSNAAALVKILPQLLPILPELLKLLPQLAEALKGLSSEVGQVQEAQAGLNSSDKSNIARMNRIVSSALQQQSVRVLGSASAKRET